MSCPICEKPGVPAYHPFCSNRCANVDLGKWLTGTYAFAALEEDDEEELAMELQENTDKPH